jgi:predicted RNA-binding protein YlxR (DUF448 family)
MRTCVECQQVRPKRELVRVVRSPQGEIGVDERGKAAGRGAYLCRSRTCWETAVTRERLDHALKTELTAEDRERLLQYGRQFGDMQTEATSSAQSKGAPGKEKEASATLEG